MLIERIERELFFTLCFCLQIKRKEASCDDMKAMIVILKCKVVYLFRSKRKLLKCTRGKPFAGK